ncbi:xanthotoxin 5-hydroxylase CYP82C4-like [Nymphaea colorata]|nr:xanthotoxin 5-hydroxylase CYP82C4-like [Nymphaea colorata]
MKQHLSFLALNIVLRMVTGQRYDLDEGKEFSETLDEFVNLLGMFTVSDAIPLLGWLDVGGHLKAMKRIHLKMDQVASAWLAEHCPKESSSAGEKRDLIDVLIKELEDGHLSENHQTDAIIKATTMAIVKESMCLYPATPLLLPHESMEPVQLAGFEVPVGSTLFVNVWKIHRDPTFWTDPEEFKPKRFLCSRNELTSFGGQDFAFLPFGSGRRGFKWSTPMDEPVDMTEGHELALPKATPLGVLLRTTPLHRTLAALSEKHGPLFSPQLGQRRAIVVSSTDLAKECFTVNDRAFAGRPQLEGWKRLGYDRATFAFISYGPHFRELRKIVATDLLSSQQLELVKHIRVDEVGSLVRRLYGSCSNHDPVEMNQHLSCLAMNIVLRMVARKQYFDLDGEGKEFREALAEFNNLVGTFTVSDAIPWLGWLDVGGHLQAMKRVHLKIDGVASAWLAEHRQKESSSAGEERDLIDVLIKELEDGHLSENHQTDAIIKATATVLVVAGTETTAVTLEWALSLLLNNPHLLKKAHDELDCHIGKERQVDETDVNNLPYLQAIVKESMRLYPMGPLLVPHESMESIQLGGFELPVGSTLFVNVWKIHHDPTLWMDPEEFKPERFLSSCNEMTSFGGQDFAFLPFGSGRRICVHWQMAMQVLHLTVARLLQSFEWSTPMNEPVDMTEGHGLALPKATPLSAFEAPSPSPPLLVTCF